MSGSSLYNCRVECMHDNVLVRMVDPSVRKTPGGIYIPEQAESTPTAQVVAVGPGSPLNPIKNLAPGDLVILAKYIGNKILVNDQMHMFVRYTDIQSKLTFLDNEGNPVIVEVPEDAFLSDRFNKQPSSIVSG